MDLLANSAAAGGSGTGSILEEFVDSLLPLPFDLKRYLALLRDLDEKRHEDAKQLQVLQDLYLTGVRAALAGAGDNLDVAKRTAIVDAHDPDSLAEIVKLRKRLELNSEEKISVAMQLRDMGDLYSKRLETDLLALEALLREQGQLAEHSVSVGKLVAACTSGSGGEELWILARVEEYSPAQPDRCAVKDADSDASYVVPTKNVVVLEEHEDVASARDRLPPKGRLVMAMYPDTTSFYRAVLTQAPFRAGPSEGALLQNKVVCVVQFPRRRGPRDRRPATADHVHHLRISRARRAPRGRGRSGRGKQRRRGHRRGFRTFVNVVVKVTQAAQRMMPELELKRKRCRIFVKKKYIVDAHRSLRLRDDGLSQLPAPFVESSESSLLESRRSTTKIVTLSRVPRRAASLQSVSAANWGLRSGRRGVAGERLSRVAGHLHTSMKSGPKSTKLTY